MLRRYTTTAPHAIATVYDATAAVYRASPNSRPDALKALIVATEALDVLFFAICGGVPSFRVTLKNVEATMHDARTASSRARMLFES